MEIYRAVVEDNNHPDKNGRVRVRIYGLHSDDLSMVKTEELPWAEVMQKLNFAGSGLGLTEIPTVGTWVFVILDHGYQNKPIIIGAISGKSMIMPDVDKGFCDPLSNVPKEDRLKEYDVNRLSRVEKLDVTIHNSINTSLDAVSKSDGVSGADVSMNEPNSTNDASVYPNVAVQESVSGHIQEVDDTPGNERLRTYHMSGSYVETKPDGSTTTKTVGALDYFVRLGDVEEHIAASIKTYVELNMNEIIDGYVRRHIGGSLDEHIDSDVTRTMDSNLTEVIGGDTTITTTGTGTVKYNSGLDLNGGPSIKATAGTIFLN